MKSKLLNDEPKTYALVLDSGDEAVEALRRFAEAQALSASRISALGAFSQAVLGFYDMNRQQYDEVFIPEQVEVVSFVGNIALAAGEPQLHPHVVVARRNGLAHGGRLLEGHVHSTLEVVITESPLHLRRKPDAATGLALLDLE